MTTKRLTGLDGNLTQATLGTPIVGDDTTALTDGFYIANTVLATGSGLPTGMQAKYVFKGDATITPATGETVTPVTFANLCFVQNASLEFTKDEFESTTLCDEIKVYELGRSDIAGSIDGVATVGDATVEGTTIVAKKFIDTVTQTADLSGVEITEIDNNAIYLQLETNKASTKGENTQFYLFPAVLTSFSASAQVDGLQTFTSAFRIASDDSIKTQLFELEQPVV